MEIRHLKYFLTVAEELNFTKAAEKLYISQPPLSRQIKELEKEIGAELFSRSNKRVELTEAGKYFQKEAQAIVRNLEAASLKARKISDNVSGEYRIAYISSTFSEIISKLIQYLTHQFPFLTIKLYEVSTVKQIEALEDGKLDLGILRAPVVSTKIDTRLLFKDRYSLVYNKNISKISKSSDLSNLANEVFVFFNKDYAPRYYDSLIEICSHYGFIPNVVHESNNINSIIQLVRNGLGISIVPSSVQKNHNYPELGFIELSEIFQTDVLLACPSHIQSQLNDSAIEYLMNTDNH